MCPTGEPLNGENSAARRRGFPHRSLALVCLLLGVAAIAQYEDQGRLWDAAERFVRAFGIGARWPLDVSAMALEPAGDLASDVVAEAAIRDVSSGAGSGSPSSHGPSASRESRSPADRELRAARDLMLDCIVARPGWAYHRLLLGRIEEASVARYGSSSGPHGRRVWEPLRQATEAAPGLDAAWIALAGASVEYWPVLSSEARSRSSSVLRRAFMDREFVSRYLFRAGTLLGRNEALSLLPDDTGILSTAAEMLLRDGEVERAKLLLTRRDGAERKRRAMDLRLMEQVYQDGDEEALRTACHRWMSDHPPAELEDPSARAQAARVLELWPDEGGSWPNDPRVMLVRFLLNRSGPAVNPRALVRCLGALSGVPDAVLARAKLLAGDFKGAAELAGAASRLDPVEWNSYLLDLARQEWKRSRAAEAQVALQRMIGPDEPAECDALLLWHDIARVSGRLGDLEPIDRRLALLAVRSRSGAPASGSRGAPLSFCLNGKRSETQILAIEVRISRPTVLSYGWDGVRSGRIAAFESPTVLRLPVTGLSGAHRLLVLPADGGGIIEQVQAALEEPTG